MPKHRVAVLKVVARQLLVEMRGLCTPPHESGLNVAILTAILSGERQVQCRGELASPTLDAMPVHVRRDRDAAVAHDALHIV